MTKSKQPNDDLAQANRENRPLHPGRRFRVEIGNEKLEFQDVILDDPVVLGRQLVESVGASPVIEYVAIALLKNGDFETLRLDEPFDLRGRGAERVLVVRSDRVYRFQIDDRAIEWPSASISVALLEQIAKLPDNYSLWREIPGGHDIKLQDQDLVQLNDSGVEQFISLPDQTTEGLEALPQSDCEFLDQCGVSHQVLQVTGQTGVVLKDFALPPEKFNVDTADVLILLPSGYPDCAPDMFYTSPQLVLRSTGEIPKATNAQHNFADRVWQRWSRHNTTWRPGIDGLRTMIARARTAFEGAQC